jgi:nucleotide-binding universal stress UspA family protein
VILVCYDGSADAQAAIDRAGELLGGQDATILTVWEPFIDVMARSGVGLGLGGTMANVEEIDAASERAAQSRADEGAGRARDAGLNPQPRTRARGPSIAETILEEAQEVRAVAVVLGTRGLTGLKSLLLGSVSHAVLQRADRAVMVVPSPEIAGERTSHRA